MYITYTYVHLAILLIRQILGAVPLPVSSPLAVEALHFRLGSKLEVFCESSNNLPILLENPFLALFLETSGIVNHQLLMLLFDFYLRSCEHSEELGNCLLYPLHI